MCDIGTNEPQFFETSVVYIYDCDTETEISTQKWAAMIASPLKWEHVSDVIESLSSG
jgi:hypothetical protein